MNLNHNTITQYFNTILNTILILIILFHNNSIIIILNINNYNINMIYLYVYDYCMHCPHSVVEISKIMSLIHSTHMHLYTLAVVINTRVQTSNKHTCTFRNRCKQDKPTGHTIHTVKFFHFFQPAETTTAPTGKQHSACALSHYLSQPVSLPPGAFMDRVEYSYFSSP